MLNLLITPTGAVAIALADAHRRHEKNSTKGTPSKLHRARFEVKSPMTFSKVEVIRNEPGERTKESAVTYNFIANPADYMIGKNALYGGSLVNKVGPMQLALFKAGLREYLPSLPDNALDDLSDENCRLQSLTVGVYFRYSSETLAITAFMKMLRHSKAGIDFSEPMPARQAAWRKSPPRVHSDPDNRHAFSIDLPFGQARVSLKRDHDAYPDSFRDVDDADERIKLCKATRCLLCFDIEVDLRRPFYNEDSKGYVRLPNNYRDWTRENLPVDPAKLIWDAFRYETWLSTELIADESEVDRSRLSRQQEEVLDAYFAGERVTPNERMRRDPKEFADIREALIKKTHVDILNPWAAAKLNLSRVLGPELVYESRFNPGQDPDFAPHTLSKGNVQDAISSLETAIARKLETLSERGNRDQQQ